MEVFDLQVRHKKNKLHFVILCVDNWKDRPQRLLKNVEKETKENKISRKQMLFTVFTITITCRLLIACG